MKKFFKNLSKQRIKLVAFLFCFVVLAAPTYANGQTVSGVAAGVAAGAGVGSVVPGVGTAVGAVAGGVAAVVAPAATKFAGGFIGSIAGVVIGWIAYVVNYIIASIFGVAVGILAWFISMVLQLNTNIVQSNIVTSGFRVTLALANLGFVMAIIVIAIMTILRYETYALKKTLWKLVAAAILVNFSLVICAAILNFADTLTLYFLNAFNPGGSISAFDSFSTSLAGAFAPQRVFLNLNAQGQSITDTNYDAFAGAGTSFAPTLVALMNLFFPTIFLMVSVIALAGLFIMLLIRYVYLGILLILMPMAWLLWIFPVTSSQWQKWWHNFIKWTIFAPVVMFFLYLALMTLGGANANQVNDPSSFFNGLGITQNINSPSAGFVSTTLGGSSPTFGSTILGSLLQMVMMVAIVFAGLFMANSMGIMFADTTLKGAKYVTSSFGKFASRRGVIGAGWAMNKARIPKAVGWLQKGVGAKPQGLLAKAYKYSGAEYAGQKLGYGLHAVHVATREGAVDEAEKRVAGMKKREAIGLFFGGTNPEKIVIMKRAAKDGFIKDLDLKNNLKENIFKAYHIEIPNYKDVSEGKGAMLNEEAINALETALTTGNDDTLDEAIRKIVVSTTKGKIGSNDNIGDIYGSHGRDENGNYKTFGGLSGEETQKWLRSLTKNIVTKNFALISSMIPKMNSKERDNFSELFEEVIKGLRATGNKKDADDADEKEKNYKRIITSNTLGYAEPVAAAASGTAPGGGAPAGGGASSGGTPGGGTTP